MATGGYFQTENGLSYVSDPSLKASDDDYRQMIRAKAAANNVDGTIRDVYDYLVTFYGLHDATIDSDFKKVDITILERDIYSQGNRHRLNEIGPRAAGTNIEVANWTNEYMNFIWDDPDDWTVSKETIDSVRYKVVTADISALPIYADIVSDYNIKPSEAAHGRWNFMFRKSLFSNDYIIFIASHADSKTYANQRGYALDFASPSRINLVRIDNGVSTILMQSDPYEFPTSDYFNLTVTRSTEGEFAIYVDDVLVSAETGSNPVTDDTYDECQYIYWDVFQDIIVLAKFDEDEKATDFTPLEEL